MSKGLRFLVLFSVLSVVMVPILVMLILSGGYGAAAGYGFCYVLLSALLYNRYVKARKPRYPLASPVMNPDAYFPRTDIPRPIHKDLRDYPRFFKKRQKDDEGSKGKTRRAHE